VSRLFIELFLDQDVSVVVADILQSRGFAATTARQAGQLDRSDDSLNTLSHAAFAC
jgi:hypothetical protein